MDKFRSEVSPNAHRLKGISIILVLVGLAVCVVFPRLMVIGGLPATDEGFYAYQAQAIYHSLSSGQGLPDNGTLALYPMLVSWVFGLELNEILVLRCIDLIFAVAVAALLYKVLARESGHRIGAMLLTALFIFAANQPIFIQYGFKNSITVAFVPLLLAVLIAQKRRPGTDHAWFAVGALTAIAILLRETFLMFALLGFSGLLVSEGRQAVYRYCIGGLMTGLAILGVITILRGGFEGLLGAYREGSLVYAAIENERYRFFIHNGLASVVQAQLALLFSAVALTFLIVLSFARRDVFLVKKILFWVCAAGFPVLEPATKIGFPYHFAVSLIGLAGLCALAWRHTLQLLPKIGPWALTLFAASLILVYQGPQYKEMSKQWPASSRAYSILAQPSWPQDLVVSSNYLLFADAIDKAIPKDATVSVSGFMFALYPLTYRLPPSPDLANLSATLFHEGMSQDSLAQKLTTCGPDIIITTTRTDWPGEDLIVAAVNMTGLYEKIADIPVDSSLHYGSFGGSIYRLVPSLESSPAKNGSC